MGAPGTGSDARGKGGGSRRLNPTGHERAVRGWRLTEPRPLPGWPRLAARARGFGAKFVSRPSPVPRRCRPSLTPGLPRCLPRSAAAMIGQRTLHSFFSPAPAKKRGRSPEPGGDSEVAIGRLRDPAALEERREGGGSGGGTCVSGSVCAGGSLGALVAFSEGSCRSGGTGGARFPNSRAPPRVAELPIERPRSTAAQWALIPSCMSLLLGGILPASLGEPMGRSGVFPADQ